jgi:mono/diheme cytochrome c family protein
MCRPDRRLGWALALAASFVLAACQQKMADQPRYQPLQRSTFFGDDRSARPRIPGTVAREDPQGNAPLFTGLDGHTPVADLPLPVTQALIQRGQERFEIFCAPCHDRVGTGNGMIAQRGYRHPPSYHIARLRDAPIGHFFEVMTHGFGQMPSYADQIAVQDRWAIAAYIRALQLSEHAELADAPAAERARLQEQK